MANELMQGGASVMLKKSPASGGRSSAPKPKPDRYEQRAKKFDESQDYGPLSGREIGEDDGSDPTDVPGRK